MQISMESDMGQIHHGDDADPAIELRARLEAQLASIEQLRREVEQEVAKRAPQPARRRFHVLPGGMAAAAVGAGGWRVRDHSVAIALTAASLAVVLVVPSSIPPSSPAGTPPLAAPPPTDRIGPPQPGDEDTAPPKKRRRFPIPPEADPVVVDIPVDTESTRRIPPPVGPPHTTKPPATRPSPQPEPPPTTRKPPRRCLAAALPPPDVDVELERCVDTIVGYLAEAA